MNGNYAVWEQSSRHQAEDRDELIRVTDIILYDIESAAYDDEASPKTDPKRPSLYGPRSTKTGPDVFASEAVSQRGENRRADLASSADNSMATRDRNPLYVFPTNKELSASSGAVEQSR